MRILVIEDELDLLYALKKGLKQEGYGVDLAKDGLEALELLEENEYDLAILDLNLPKLNGYRVLEELRKNNNKVKVLILSANSDIEDRVKGLDLGANDYLVKPFSLRELKARLRALLRRDFMLHNTVLVFGALKMDITGRILSWEEKEINLTNKEFSLLEYLILHRDCYITSEDLIEHVWDEEADLFSNAIRVHIYSLRKKLLKATGYQTMIETMPSAGYRFYSRFWEEGNKSEKLEI